MILPMIDVPVSIIGTFAVMAALGFSLNNISLFGLVLAVGIVVDDAIVVLENIERLMATGLDARTATLKAMDEVTGPIIAVALVLCAVFVPCAVVGGITGQFFRQFAVTIAVSTVISAINAVTMTPSRAVLIFKADEKTRAQARARSAAVVDLRRGRRSAHGLARAAAAIARRHLDWPRRPGQNAFFNLRNAVSVPARGAASAASSAGSSIRPVNAVLGWVFRGFNRGLRLDDRPLRLGGQPGAAVERCSSWSVYAGLLGLTWWTFVQAPTGFIPQQDQGRLIVNVQLPDSSSLERTKEVVAQVDAICRETPGVRHTVAFAGMSFVLQASSPNFASMFIVLDPFDERQKPELARHGDHGQAARRLGQANQGRAWSPCTAPSPIPGVGVGRRFQVDDPRSRRSGPRRTAEADRRRRPQAPSRCPGLNNVTTQFRSNTPQLLLDVDRTKSPRSACRSATSIKRCDVPRLAVRQQLQRIRPALAGHRSGRGRVSAIEVEDVNLFQVRNNRGSDGAARHAARTSRDRRADLASRATTCTRPPRSTATCRPGLSSRRGDRHDRPQSPPRRCRCR